MKKALPLLYLLTLIAFNIKAQQPQATTPPNPNLKWFTDARFGMFIHWDMSSVAGTEISWSRN